MSGSVVDQVKRLIARIPDLAPYEAQLKIVFGFHQECVAAPTPMSLSDADDFLATFLNTDKKGLMQVINQIDQVLNQRLVGLVSMVQEMTGVLIDLKQDKIPAEKRMRSVEIIEGAVKGRLKEENDEQDACITAAEALLADCATVIESLGLRPLWDEKNAKPTVAPKQSLKELVKQNLKQVLIDKGVIQVVEAPVEVVVGDWLTDPVLRTDDEALKKAISRVQWIIKQVNNLLKDEKTRQLFAAKDENTRKMVSETVLRQLSIAMTKQQLEEQIFSIQDLAHDQISQSKHIKVIAEKDANGYLAQLSEVDEPQTVLYSIIRFFFPQPA